MSSKKSVSLDSALCRQLEEWAISCDRMCLVERRYTVSIEDPGSSVMSNCIGYMPRKLCHNSKMDFVDLGRVDVFG